MRSRKGASTTVQAVVGVAILALVGGGVIGAFMFTNQGSGLDGDTSPAEGEDVDTPDQADEVAKFDGRNVKLNLEANDLGGNTITSGDIYLFENQPEEFGDASSIDSAYNDADSTYTVDSSGTTTIQETPDTYYMVLDHSGAYPLMTEVQVPNGENYQNVALSEYNQAPELEKVEVADKASVTSKTFDLGVSSDSSGIELFDTQTFSPAEDTEYRLDYVVVEDGSVPTTSDADTDGTYDEGVSEFSVEVSGAVGQSSSLEETVFNPDNGVNQLDNDGKTKVDVETASEPYLTFDRDNRMSIEANSVADTGTGSATAGDETLQDSENIFDLTLFRADGSSSPTMGVVG